MRREILPWAAVLLLLVLVPVALAATSTVALTVEGMT